MDNLKAAREQIKIVAGVLEDNKNKATLDNLIGIAKFYVLFDIAESLRVLNGDRGK